MKFKKISFLVSCVLLVSVSCSDYQKLLNSDDTSEKYKQAEVFYNNGEYRKANRLFEQIVPKYRGKPQAQRIIFFFADSYFQTKSYSLAAYQYENFVKSYPKSDRIQEATFKAAKSYYFQSPTYSLDQEETYEAIEKLQIFINLYPSSEYAAEANQMIAELQEKLEKKDFEIAVSSIQDHIKNLSKNKLENEELISKLENENKLLKSQIEVMQKTLIKDDNPKFGFTDSSKRENIIASEKNYDELKDQHQKDIDEVQNILVQLKDLVEE